MRVITGSARGRRLISPEGFDVRPTTDKVKESVFNIIQFELQDAAVLDLFAGSGQLGIEALSRGAQKVVFVDSSKKSIETVKKNISLCKFDLLSQTVFADAFSFLVSCKQLFDVVFLDPPYNKGLCNKALQHLQPCLNEDALIICETQIDEELPDDCGSIRKEKEYIYSAIKLTLYRFCSTEGDDDI